MNRRSLLQSVLGAIGVWFGLKTRRNMLMMGPSDRPYFNKPLTPEHLEVKLGPIRKLTIGEVERTCKRMELYPLQSMYLKNELYNRGMMEGGFLKPYTG